MRPGVKCVLVFYVMTAHSTHSSVDALGYMHGQVTSISPPSFYRLAVATRNFTVTELPQTLASTEILSVKDDLEEQEKISTYRFQHYLMFSKKASQFNRGDSAGNEAFLHQCQGDTDNICGRV